MSGESGMGKKISVALALLLVGQPSSGAAGLIFEG